MEKTKSIWFAFALVVAALIVWYAIDVVLIAFAAILLAILLNFLGVWTKKIIHIPYPLALLSSLIFILGVLVLIFWLYSPLIATQFQLLVKQLPDAAETVRKNIAPFLESEFFSKAQFRQEFALAMQKIMSHFMTVFSFTIGSIVGFLIFIIVGFYLAMDPKRYIKGFFFVIPQKNMQQVTSVFERIGRSLRWWLLGKVVAMIAIGILSFLGLWILKVNLAFILGLLAALLTFIPYIGPILSAIPAVLIAFTQSPWTALYVIILYLGIHLVEGYFLTPTIEQKTVSLPPAVTIMTQVLMVVLVGGLGLALATPLTVVFIALFQQKANNY